MAGHRPPKENWIEDSRYYRRKTRGGAECPACRETHSVVCDSRPTDAGRHIRRRRGCLECSHRWGTIEISREYFDELEDIAQLAGKLRAAHGLSDEQQKILGEIVVEFKRVSAVKPESAARASGRSELTQTVSH